MSKKTILTFAVAGLGAVALSTLISKKERFSKEEKETIDKYKEYLEEKDYIVVDKKNYKKQVGNILSLSSLPLYYKAAKKVAKFVL
ncbi:MULTISPECIES: hypothetical protein [Gemella]|uniref:hypothetical protein n=1 Tax=Gemella TaxID=1378 RepID=UPI0007684033|nr:MULTISPECIES: hypothetical protein [Gemella]AME09639.1 hypothetical protein AXE85_05485 [Gemella sp. oral taxon 928]AXI27242.1 hypothetical protein CG018_07415 [Gemella sp. ND 6198]